MKIDQETLRKIAHLARLKILPEDEQSMIESLTEILDWVEKLDELDTAEVEPLTNMSSEFNALREDDAERGLTHEEGLKNAPERDQGHFIVPKIIE